MPKLKPLRIAMVLSADPHAAGGIQSHIFYLSQELKKLGHQVTVFGPTAPHQQFYPNYFSVGQRLAMPAPNGGWGEITLSNADTQETITRLNSGEFDVCHVHSPYLPFVNWQIMTQIHLPIVTTFHIAWQKNSNLSWFTPLFQPISSVIGNQVKAAIFVSHQAQKNWQTICPTHTQQHVIANGVSAEFKPSHQPLSLATGATDQPVKLLFLARLVQSKGLGYLLEALALLPKTLNWHLTVVGTGKGLADFKTQVKNLHFSRKVTFTGEILGSKVVPYFQSHDIFCAPYFDEGGTSLSIIEAMACGLPVIGFTNPAFQDVMVGYPDASLFVKVKDTQLLADALYKLITQPKLRHRIGKWAALRTKHFSWKAITQKTTKIYRSVTTTLSS